MNINLCTEQKTQIHNIGPGCASTGRGWLRCGGGTDVVTIGALTMGFPGVSTSIRSTGEITTGSGCIFVVEVAFLGILSPASLLF